MGLYSYMPKREAWNTYSWIGLIFLSTMFVESWFLFIHLLYCWWSNDSTSMITSFAGRSASRPAARSPPPKPGIDFYIRSVVKGFATLSLGLKCLCACIFFVGVMCLFFQFFSFLVLMLYDGDLLMQFTMLLLRLLLLFKMVVVCLEALALP